MPKLIIGLVGRQGSGKGTVATMLRSDYGAEVFRFSAALGDVLDRLSIDRSRDNLIAISVALRQAFGEDALSYAVGRDALASKADIVVVDGIRRIEDVAALEPLPIFKLIEIAAPAKVRFERMKGRGEKVGESLMTWDQFMANEQVPTEASIAGVTARAWRAIDNSGSPQDLETHLTEVMAELGLSPSQD